MLSIKIGFPLVWMAFFFRSFTFLLRFCFSDIPEEIADFFVRGDSPGIVQNKVEIKICFM